MESEVLLSSGEDAVDANGIFAEVACDVQSGTSVSVEELSTLKFYLELAVWLVVLSLGHEV